MPFDPNARFTAEPANPHGSGLEHWRVVRESDHFATSDEKVLRGRVDVRRRFAAGFADAVSDLMRKAPADGEGK